MFQNLNTLLRTLVLAGAVGVAGWWTLFLKDKLDDRAEELAASEAEVERLAGVVEKRDLRIEEMDRVLDERQERIEELGRDLAASEAEVRELAAAIGLLKVDHRLARIEVLAQGAGDEDPEAVRSTVRFTELDGEGAPIGEGQVLTVEGTRLFLESLVIKFGDDFVEGGDALRGTSICLFQRAFGERQQPNGGTPIDPVGVQPLVYRGTRRRRSCTASCGSASGTTRTTRRRRARRACAPCRARRRSWSCGPGAATASSCGPPAG